MAVKNLEGNLNRTQLVAEITNLVYIAVADSSNLGKTCIPIPLSRNYLVSDGHSILIKGKGNVFFTRKGIDKDSPLECNFFPNLNEAYEIRRSYGENHSDKIKKDSKFRSANRIPSLFGTIERKVYGASKY